jgi:hypothetical protein
LEHPVPKMTVSGFDVCMFNLKADKHKYLAIVDVRIKKFVELRTDEIKLLSPYDVEIFEHDVRNFFYMYIGYLGLCGAHATPVDQLLEAVVFAGCDNAYGTIVCITHCTFYTKRYSLFFCALPEKYPLYISCD